MVKFKSKDKNKLGIRICLQIPFIVHINNAV